MKQIIMIHGGSIFPSIDRMYEVLSSRDYDPRRKEKQSWKDRLANAVSATHEARRPEMPSRDNASYTIRKMRFEKMLPYLNSEDTILIGHSLGGQFLIKYLGENGFPKKIKQLHLVSAVLDESDMPDGEEYMGDFAYDAEIISHLEQYAEQIFIYHSTDDDIVPYTHAQTIWSHLPKSKLITFTDRGHFSQERFPELLENIVG